MDRVPLRDMARSLPLAARGQSTTTPGTPIPVRAWIVTGRGVDLEVDAEVTSWTARAVHVRYIDEHGREGFAWLWASAVTRRMS